jgi:glycosyltransferase involved in cell wall biosynthesis
LKILVIPTTDWIGHPVVERQHQIFERLTVDHDVHVLRFKYCNERNLKTKTTVHEINDSIENSLVKYYLVNSIKHREAIKRIVRENKIEIVVMSNLLPAFTSIDALKKTVPTVFDLSDHFPSSAAGYVGDIDSFIGKTSCSALEILMKHILKNVDCTVACSYPLKTYAEEQRLRGSISVIPNGVEASFLNQNVSGKAVRDSYNLGKSIVIGYVGMIEFWVNIPPLLSAIKKLSKTHEIKLFLIGKQFQTNTGQSLLRLIKKLDLTENVVWSRGWIHHSNLPEYIAAMDICTIPFRHLHPTAYYCSPNKLWEYLAVGRPVITTPLPDVIVQAKKYVDFAVTAQDYYELINSYTLNPEPFLAKVKDSRTFVEDHTWERITKMYEKILLENLSRRNI